MKQPRYSTMTILGSQQDLLDYAIAAPHIPERDLSQKDTIT